MTLQDAREAALQAGREVDNALVSEGAEEYALALETGAIDLGCPDLRDHIRLDWCERIAAEHPELQRDGLVPMTRAGIDAAMRDTDESRIVDATKLHMEYHEAMNKMNSINAPQHNHLGNCRQYSDPWGHEEWCRHHGMMRGACPLCPACSACGEK